MRIPKYPKHSQSNTAIKWLMLYHSYPHLLLFVPTIRPKSFGASGHSKAVWAMRPWLNFLRDAIACSAHAEAAPHWNQNLQLWSRPKQQNKKENQANLLQIKHVPVFLKKNGRKVFHPFPLRGLWRRDCVFGFLQRHWKIATQVTPQMLVRPRMTWIVDKSGYRSTKMDSEFVPKCAANFAIETDTHLVWSPSCQFSQSRQVQAQVRNFQVFLLPGCKPTSARTRTASTCMYWTTVNSEGFANWGGQTLLMGHQLTLPPNLSTLAQALGHSLRLAPAAQSQVTQAHKGALARKGARLRVKLCTLPAGLNSQLTGSITCNAERA